MAVYVDPLMNHGWVLYGRAVPSCHLLTDDPRLEELHALAGAIGMKRTWFQSRSIPHYDLTPKRRSMAIAAGALEIDRRRSAELIRWWRERRATQEGRNA